MLLFCRVFAWDWNVPLAHCSTRFTVHCSSTLFIIHGPDFPVYVWRLILPRLSDVTHTIPGRHSNFPGACFANHFDCLTQKLAEKKIRHVIVYFPPIRRWPKFLCTHTSWWHSDGTKSIDLLDHVNDLFMSKILLCLLMRSIHLTHWPLWNAVIFGV